MNELEKLIAIESIKQTKAKYFYCLDTKDWNSYAQVFTEDAQMDMRAETHDENNLIDGRDNIAQYVSQAVSRMITVHHGHMPAIEFVSDTEAKVIWAMEDKLWLRESENSVKFFMHGYGHYRETYRRIGDRWLIQGLNLTRLRVDLP